MKLIPKRLVTLATPTLVMVLFSLRGTPAPDAWITGTVVECREGKTKPVAGLRVYTLGMDESSKIRGDLKRIESLQSSGGVIDAQAFLRLYDELTSDVKSLGEAKGLVRTDKSGQFTSHLLERKQKYLVLAIDWDKGDTDELAYYRYQYTELTTSGTHEIHIYMGPGNEADCREK